MKKRKLIEALISPLRARKNPLDLFFIAIVFVSFGVLVHFVFPKMEASVVIFTMIPAIPLTLSLLLKEEKEEEKRLGLLKKYSFTYHKPLLKVYAYFFLGVVAGFVIWYLILPQPAAEEAFKLQLTELENLRRMTGGIISQNLLWKLFEHNAYLLFFMFLFSLIYGIGAIYLLSWNASVIGVFIGSNIKSNGLFGGVAAALGVLPHGLFEVSAYLIASIAGGIFSVAIMRKTFEKPEFKYILLDVVLMAVISVLMIAIGAVIESSY